jgi:murein DD-endopeptidase MepM/ murein hydrolase activator NlpD
MRSIVWDGDLGHEQDFGCTPLTVEPWWAEKGCHWHCGIDVSVAKGAQLRAARAGIVAYVGLGELGISVIGTSPPEVDYYIHIDRSLVSPGQLVARGQACAISGDKVPSGGVLYGAHLHFERQLGWLNVPKTSLDPVPVLSGLFSGGSGSLGGDEMKVVGTSQSEGPGQWVTDGITKRGIADPPESSQMLLLCGQTSPLILGKGYIDRIPDSVNAINFKPVLDAIKAIPAGSVTSVDLRPVLDKLDAIKAVVDKIDRGD